MRLTAKEYAARLGISGRAVRMQLQKGKLAGFKAIDRASGLEVWWVEVATPEDPVPLEGVPTSVLPAREVLPTSEFRPTTAEFAEVPPSEDPILSESESIGSIVATFQQVMEKLHRENLELAGRLGFYQSEIQHLKAQLEGAQLQLQLAQARILELEAPKEAPAEMANHPSVEQNGQDAGAQTDSEMPEEQSEARRGSEVSAFPAVNRQEGSSAGAFKRLWRWLTRPV